MQVSEPQPKRERLDNSETAMDAAPSVQEVQDLIKELGLDDEMRNMSVEDIIGRTRLLEGEIRIMRSECQRITHEMGTLKDKIKVPTN